MYYLLRFYFVSDGQTHVPDLQPQKLLKQVNYHLAYKATPTAEITALTVLGVFHVVYFCPVSFLLYIFILLLFFLECFKQ